MDKPIVDNRLIKPKHLRIALPLLLVLGLGMFIVLRNPSRSYRVDKATIFISDVVREQFLDYIQVDGTVEPISIISIEALESGRVETILAEEGNMVKRGEILLNLKNEQLNLSFTDQSSNYAYLTNDLNDQLIQIKQEELSDKQSLLVEDNQLGEIKRKLDKTTRLFEKGGVSEEEYLSMKNSFEMAVKSRGLRAERMVLDAELRTNKRQQIKMKKAQIHQQLENLQVKAPADGQLTQFLPEIGQSVAKGQLLGQIQVLTSFKLTGEIDEHYIDRVRKGLTATLERASITYPLVVSKVYPQVTKAQFKVDFRFIQEVPVKLRTGQSHLISLQLGETTEAVQIPRGSFFQNTGGLWIFVLATDGRSAVKRTIRIGKQNPKNYEILDGLKPGEKIITSGYETFGDNEKLIFDK